MNDFNPHHKGALQGLFDTARREVTGETLEQIRDNYYIAAKMRGCDDSSVGGLNINSSARIAAALEANPSERGSIFDWMTGMRVGVSLLFFKVYQRVRGKGTGAHEP